MKPSVSAPERQRQRKDARPRVGNNSRGRETIEVEYTWFVLCLTIGLLSAALSAQAGGGLLESFLGEDPGAGLKWRAPVEGPSWSAVDGAARIVVPRRPGGYNHWVESVNDAPMLAVDAPGGDWDLTANIALEDYSRESAFHIGPMVGFSQGLVMTFGPFKGAATGQPIDRPELWIETTGVPPSARIPAECSALDLRISKRDNVYECFYRAPGESDWKRAGDFASAYPPEFTGILAKTFSDGPGVSFLVNDLRVDPVPARTRMSSVRVDAAHRAGAIDRNIYGHFIEHLGRCIYGGIWAEMLWNRKFTGGVDERGVIESWSAFGEGATYSRDNIDFYTSCQSQRVELAPGREAGILKKDARLGIKPGRYVVRAILKQRGLHSPVTVALRHNDEVYSSAEIAGIGEEWSEHRVELNVGARDPDAQFSISAVGPGTLWIGCLSLMPADNIEGMRRDVIEAIRAIKPPLIRWPGGNMVSGYHWEDGLGERDRRMPRWERAWKAWEWNDFGTDEYIRFCRLVNTEPYICVNAGEGQADEAARWVEYCNGSPDTPYGALRAANGHPEPYNVKYWGIGNEMYGDWQLGHLDATKYALKSIEFARAMKAVDPSILLIGVGVDYDNFGSWNSYTAAIAGSYYDYISAHYYKGPRLKDCRELTYLNLICASLEIERMLAATSEIVNRAAGRRLPIAFDEWNIWLPEGLDNSMYALRDGLFAAGVFHAMHRLNDRVTMANLAQLVNVLGAIQTNMTDLVETPIYKAFKLYVDGFLDNRVGVSVECGEFDTPSGRMKLLDASAAVDGGGQLSVAVINRDPTRDLPAVLDIRGFSAAPEARVAALNGPDVYSLNDFGKPESVRIETSAKRVEPGKQYVFPAHSVTLITFQRAENTP